MKKLTNDALIKKLGGHIKGDYDDKIMYDEAVLEIIRRFQSQEVHRDGEGKWKETLAKSEGFRLAAVEVMDHAVHLFKSNKKIDCNFFGPKCNCSPITIEPESEVLYD